MIKACVEDGGYQISDKCDGQECNYDSECESGNCSGRVCQSKFPTWGIILIAVAIVLIIAFLALLYIFIVKRRVEKGKDPFPRRGVAAGYYQPVHSGSH